MSRIGFALFLVAVGLCWLLPPVTPPVQAASQPQNTQQCTSNKSASGSGSQTYVCYFANTVAGDTVIMAAFVGGTTTSSWAGSTESPTFPAGSSCASGGGNVFLGYVHTASSHTQFTVSGAFTGSGITVYAVMATLVKGLNSTADAGSAACGISVSSLNVTTANTNEYALSYCVVNSTSIAPSSGTQVTTGTDAAGGSSNVRDLMQYQIIPTATTTALSCSPNTDIAALAWQQSSPPTVPTPFVKSTCTYSYSIAVGAPCTFGATASGDWIILGFVTVQTNTPQAFSSTEALTCQTEGATSYLIGGFTHTYLYGFCWVHTASSHASFSITENSSNVTSFLGGLQVTGLTSVDTGSETTAGATSLTYTTANPNEFTVGLAGDAASGSFAPASSFGEVISQVSPQTPPTIAQNLVMSKTTASSGSNTLSTSGGGTNPVLATVSFGILATQGFSNHSQIIGYHGGAHLYKIPWDRPRKQLELEKI